MLSPKDYIKPQNQAALVSSEIGARSSILQETGHIVLEKRIPVTEISDSDTNLKAAG